MRKILVSTIAAGVLFGCGGSSHPADGDLVIDWTIGGTKDPSACDANGATTLDVIVDHNGTKVGEYTADCSAFAVDIPLPPGTYDTNIVLEDANNTVLTTAIEGSADISSNADTSVPIAFPQSSFLAPTTGDLIVKWTIAGGTDPGSCSANGAATLDVIVNDDATGDQVGEYTADCNAFTTDIPLPPGTYDANIVLTDSSSKEVTTEITPPAVSIDAGSSQTIPVDFPLSSFL